MTRTRLSIGTAALVAGLAAVPALAQEPARSDGWVVLALDEYRALRAKALPPAPDPLLPPVEAALTRVDYTLRVNGETVTGEARLTVDVLKQGWVSVQMPAGMLVRSARVEGQPGALVDGTPPRVLISRAGRSVLALDIVVPIESAAGSESMTLPPSASALSAVTLIVPRVGVDLVVNGGFVAERTEAAAESRWTVYGSPGKPLLFSWKRRIDDRRSTLPLRMRARITELVSLGEETSLISASVRLEVVQGLARDVVLATPEGVAVNLVSGATVADWRHEQGTLTVSFLEPVTSTTSLLVSAETRTLREGAVGIPLIRVPGAERETGGVAVDVVGAGEITDRQPRGLDLADASDLGDIISGRESPSMVAFGFKPLAGDASRALTVTVSRYAAQAVLVANVEEARYEALVGEDGKTLIRARYAVRNNQRAFLALKLPAQAVLWSAALAGRPIRPGLSTDGAYLLPLQKGSTGRRRADVCRRARLSPALGGLDRTRRRTHRAAGGGPARVAHRPHRPPFATVPGGAEARRIQGGTGSRPVERDASQRDSTPLRRRPQRRCRCRGQPAANRDDMDRAEARSLVDRYRKEIGKIAAGTIPVEVKVPDIGPSLFVAAELTPEARATVLEFGYKRSASR